MAKVKRECLLCKTQYKYCNTCRDSRNDPAFMMTFCSENCKDIFKSLCDFSANIISAKECYELLEKCDLSKKENYGETTLRTLGKVYAENKPDPVIEEAPIIEEPLVIEDQEIQIEEPKLYSKKKKH